MSTAQEIRNRTVIVPIEGTTLSIECRRPDPVVMITDNLLPLQTFAGVLEKFQAWSAENADADALMSAMGAESTRWNEFLDRWACAAAIEPRLVLTEEEAEANPDVLWVYELNTSTKMAIFGATANRKLVSPRVRSAIEDFRRQSLAGVDVGSDGASVRDAAVAAVRD